MDLVVEILRPNVDYPFPWRSIAGFFNVLPECHLGPLPRMEPVKFNLAQKFDLVILVYQVWFLENASLPIQDFLQCCPAAEVWRNAKVITVSVSRNMWHSASETMKTLLKTAGARHIDHVSLTHQGPAWATFITTPRALLFGKKEGFWGVFPPAGLSAAELEGVGRFRSSVVLQQRDQLRYADDVGRS